MRAAHLLPQAYLERAKDFLLGHAFECFIAVLLAVYFALNLTPSSYAYILRALGVDDTGLLFGQPSALRTDEFAVWTPLTQATVRNAFERFNETSPYREDLRNFNALPLWDWGFLFKPQLWGFFLLPPDRAFSLYHTLLIGGSLIGWSLAFRNWGFPALWAAAASLLFFFSGTTQFWWTTSGPLVAILPFVLLAFCSEINALYKLGLLTWLMAVWLLSHFYPPVIISLGLAGLFLLAAFRPDAAFNWRNILVATLALVTSAALVRVYFAGVFEIMAATVYPGARSLPGGLLSWSIGIAHYLPFLTTHWDASLIGANAPEVVTASSYLPLTALVFLDWRKFRVQLRGGDSAVALFRWTFCVLSAGLLLLAAWMFLPIPNWVGHALLFDKILPARMMYGSGLLLLAISLLLLKFAGARWSFARFLLLAAIVVVAWAVAKVTPSAKLQAAGVIDLVIIPVFALAGLWLLRQRDFPVPLMLFACLAVNIVGFGWINPLQSAKPIFADVDSPLIRAIRHFQDRDPRHWTVVPGLHGAVLNGIGMKSISHVLPAPQLAFLRPYFPKLGDEEFNQLFNRYNRLELHPIDRPRLLANDAVALPISRFIVTNGSTGTALPATWKQSPPERSRPGGHLDNIETDGDRVHLTGWAMLDPTDKNSRIIVVADRPVSILRATSIFRPDVVAAPNDPRLLRSGFDLELAFTDGNASKTPIRVFSESPHYGVRELHMPIAD